MSRSRSSSRTGLYGTKEASSISRGGASAAADIRDRVNRECGRDILSTADLDSFREKDSGWAFRLEQVDKDLAEQDKAMESMMREMQGWKRDLSDAGEGKKKKKAGKGKGGSGKGEDLRGSRELYKDVSRKLATEGAEGA